MYQTKKSNTPLMSIYELYDSLLIENENLISKRAFSGTGLLFISIFRI